ncbi:MAG TPA: hypothetical protein PKH98_05175 [Candidatus Omnitrophota bacterium]|nr:hypothetical protein [Candidatus Omnitrophota bacterium]
MINYKEENNIIKQDFTINFCKNSLIGLISSFSIIIVAIIVFGSFKTPDMSVGLTINHIPIITLISLALIVMTLFVRYLRIKIIKKVLYDGIQINAKVSDIIYDKDYDTYDIKYFYVFNDNRYDSWKKYDSHYWINDLKNNDDIVVMIDRNNPKRNIIIWGHKVLNQ